MPTQEVRLQSLEGQWETVGVDRLAGLFPEGVNPTANINGSDTLRFRLKRDPGAVYPDLSAFTPCEVLENSTVIWSGRVWETPTKEGPDSGISVEGRGWQYHLDDYPYAYPYARTRMNFRDARQVLNANLGYWKATGEVSNEGSSVLIGWRKGTAVLTGQDGVGVRYDLGPDYAEVWADFLLTVKTTMADPTIGFYVRAHDSEDSIGNAPVGPGTDYEDLYYIANSSTLSAVTHLWLTGTVPRRYVSVFLFYEGTGGTFGADNLLQIQSFQMYGKPTYREMINKPHVRMSDIAQDAVQRAAPLFKSSTERSATFFDEVMGNPALIEYWDFGKYDPTTTQVYGELLGVPQTKGGTVASDPTLVTSGIDNSLGTEPGSHKAAQMPGDIFFVSQGLSLPQAGLGVVGVFRPDTLPQYGNVFFVGSSVGPNTGWGYYIGPGAASSNLYFLNPGVAWTDTGITLTAGDWYFFRAHWSYWFQTMDIEVYDVNGLYGSHSFTHTPGLAIQAIYWAGTDSTSESQITLDKGAIFSAPFESWDSSTEGALLDRMRESVFHKTEGNVQRSTFWIPEFPMETAQTPREVINAGNAFHDYLWKADHKPSLAIKERPSGALFEVGTWSGAEFEDASANSGEEIYNMVRVEATDVLGDPLVINRGGFNDDELINFANPGFEVDTSGWSMAVPGQSTITRDTAVKRTGTASGRIDVTSAPHTPTAVSSSFVGQFESGHIYKAVTYIYRTAKANAVGEIAVTNTVGSATETIDKAIPPGGIGLWHRVELMFRFETIGTIEFRIQNQTDGTTGTMFYLDDLQILSLDNSLPSRRGFIRAKVLPVSAAATPAALERIGDVWVESRRGTPFKGTLKAASPEGVRRLATGDNVSPSELLNNTGEKILFSHRIDPDTGAHGRLGTINTVSYEGSTGVATITIDNTRQSFESLLQRYTGIVSTKR